MKTNFIQLYLTDTVYGLGVDATNPSAIRLLRELKGSGSEKHYAIIVADMNMARHYGVFTPLAEKLAKQFWPGKLTLVLEAKNLPQEIAPDGTIGIRIPNHPVALALVRERGVPLTATSANVSGMPPQKTLSKIMRQFGAQSCMIYHTADCPTSLPISKPSTVVDARSAVPIFIREGAINKETILNFV